MDLTVSTVIFTATHCEPDTTFVKASSHYCGIADALQPAQL